MSDFEAMMASAVKGEDGGPVSPLICVHTFALDRPLHRRLCGLLFAYDTSALVPFLKNFHELRDIPTFSARFCTTEKFAFSVFSVVSGGVQRCTSKMQAALFRGSNGMGLQVVTSHNKAHVSLRLRNVNPQQELADLAVEQMQGVIHTLVKKGTTSSLRAKVTS